MLDIRVFWNVNIRPRRGVLVSSRGWSYSLPTEHFHRLHLFRAGFGISCLFSVKCPIPRYYRFSPTNTGSIPNSTPSSLIKFHPGMASVSPGTSKYSHKSTVGREWSIPDLDQSPRIVDLFRPPPMTLALVRLHFASTTATPRNPHLILERSGHEWLEGQLEFELDRLFGRSRG